MASIEHLSELSMAGRERAEELIRHRPCKDWNDILKVPGFSGDDRDDLKSGGPRIGPRTETAGG